MVYLKIYIILGSIQAVYGLIDFVEIFLKLSLLKKSYTCKCGISQSRRDPRILGGSFIAQNEYPWIVSIATEQFDSHIPGTLINNLFVLTSANQVYKKIQFSLSVKFDRYNYCNSEPDILSINVVNVILHPLFVPQFSTHNLALLRLSTPVDVAPGRFPICLPPPTGVNYNGKVGIIVNSVWNPMEAIAGGPIACSPYKVALPILSKSNCDEPLSEFEDCLGVPGAPSVLCGNDSGAGIMFRNSNGYYELAGILSDKQSCPPGDNPHYLPTKLPVMTLVSQHLDWILDNSKDGCFCTKPYKLKFLSF